MDTVLAYFGYSGVKAALIAFAPFIAIYFLGLFRGSSPYRGLRVALDNFSETLGAQVSRLGNSKLKGIYEPLEDVLVDFFLFMAEQFAVGLRKDNPEKMLDHAERLCDVKSKTRLSAIIAKMTEAVKSEEAVSDPIMQKALELGRDMNKDRLSQ